MNGEMKYHYYGIDFLRVFSCIAIIIMHVLANSNYDVSGFFFTRVIPSFSELVYLFIMISGFGMCLGYHDKFKNNTVDINLFYTKRYKKIIPFFSFLLFIALTIEGNLVTVVESITELTLTFGLLPNNQLEVLGVSWTLGVIFVFYFIFPFVVFLTHNKRRAVLTFILSLLLNYFCTYYFFTDKFVIDSFDFRHSFIYCSVYFLAGSLIYVYRNNIIILCNRNKIITTIGLVLTVILYYLVPKKIGIVDIFTIKNLLLYMITLSYAISINYKFYSNKVVKYISSISMEMYLCQMILFRLVEKLNFLYKFGNGIVSFIFVTLLVVVLIILFVELYKYFFKKINVIMKLFINRKGKKV